MALWDNFADQIQTLPVAAAIDPVNDRLAYAGATRSGVQSAALDDVPHTLVWMLPASSATSSPTADTTNRKDGFRSPYAMTLVRLHLTVTTAYSTGTAPAFDLYNETDALSPIDNTTGVGTAIVPGASDTIFTDDPINVPSLPVSKSVGLYCTQGATTAIGATWAHVMYVV